MLSGNARYWFESDIAKMRERAALHRIAWEALEFGANVMARELLNDDTQLMRLDDDGAPP